MGVMHAEIASIGALIGDPARARMLTALMGGIALTATELAVEAGVTPSTASAHLAKMSEAQLLAVEKQGRHRYFRLADDDVGELLEELMTVATRTSRRRGPSDPALRAARVCYDHLAGAMGVRLFDSLKSRDLLSPSPNSETFFQRFGIDTGALAASRRPFCRTCVDWSERRFHLAGGLGAAILQRVFALRWARRALDSRAVVFSPHGERAFRAQFGL
jgi:DNA-binding transcriptional ArsR family regulator